MPMLMNRGVRLGSPSAPSSFITTFPNTESPIVGPWKQGGTDGGNFWQDMKSTPGHCVVKNPSDPLYDDGVAIYTGSTTVRPYVLATVYKDPAYTAPNTHELILYALAVMTSTTLSLYEFLMDCESSTIQFNRWDTTPYTYTTDGTFETEISGSRTAIGQLAHNDTVGVYAEIVAGNPRMSVRKNGGAPLWVVEDRTAGKFTTGQCGFGMFYRTTPGVSDPTRFNWARIEVGAW